MKKKFDLQTILKLLAAIIAALLGVVGGQSVARALY